MLLQGFVVFEYGSEHWVQTRYENVLRLVLDIMKYKLNTNLRNLMIQLMIYSLKKWFFLKL